MNKYIFFILIFINTINPGYAKNTQLSCKNNIINLTVFKKNDFKFTSEECYYNDNHYIRNTLEGYNKNNFINKYSKDGSKYFQELAAISIYKKEGKPPVLITLHTQRWCCYPSAEGIVYSINLYKIIKDKENIKLIDISKTLDDKQWGLDGVYDGYNKKNFKLKNISLIKKWLDKNYN